jgi:hypothetical protein
VEGLKPDNVISAGGAPELRFFAGHRLMPAITVHVDPAMPPDQIEIRDELGRVLGRIVNIGGV